jgi:hypothetical protein
VMTSRHPPVAARDSAELPARRRSAKGDFRGLLLSNQTHRSSSDGEARLFRKSGGTGAFLSYLGHCLMENRHGLVVASEVTPADGYGERAAAVRMARSLPGAQQKTLGADKGYDTRDFVADIRFAGITPHVAQNIQARSRRLVWLVTVEVDPIRTASEDCRHPKAPLSHQRYRPRPSCAANAGHHLHAESCWFGILLGCAKLKGAGQVHGCVSQASTQRTSPEEHAAAHGA